MYVAVKPPSIITAFGLPPSTLAVAFCCSETRACSFPAATQPQHQVDRALLLNVVVANRLWETGGDP